MVEAKELIKKIESNERAQPINKLNDLVQLAVEITGRGEIDDDYTETAHFEIGRYCISSDQYYQRVWICDDESEIEVDTYDHEKIEITIKELKLPNPKGWGFIR